MFCKACGCKMEDTDRFCPACGTNNEPAPAPVTAPDPVEEYAPVDSGAAANAGYPDDDYRTVMVGGGIGLSGEQDDRTMIFDGGAAPQPDEDVHTMVLDGCGFNAPQGPYPPADPYGYGQPEYQQNNFPPPQEQAPPPVSYQDSFLQQPDQRFGDSGYRDQSQSKRKPYQKTTAGKRIGSILLCLLMMLFASNALLIGTARLSLTESNVRKAYQKGTLADLVITTDKGEQSMADILMDGVVDEAGNKIPLDKEKVNTFLKGPHINNFVENIMVDFTRFFIFGEKPSLLNDSEIVKFIKSISEEIFETIKYKMSDKDYDRISERIKGGDLSFLSIDDNGGYFKTKYGVDPSVISNAFSVWALAISAGLALLCMILIFVINRKNPPAGLSFNGVTLIIFGALNTLIAVGLLILSYIKPIFFFSEILRYTALACGAISLCLAVIGVAFTVIRTVLRNRIK